jgi:hypothetical protein
MMNRKNKIKKLDKLWAVLVVSRDGGICQKCGKPGQNPHHIFYRRKLGSRHLLKNGITLCDEHHTPWAHAYPEDFMWWVMDKIGMKTFITIQGASTAIKIDLEEVGERLKGEM